MPAIAKVAFGKTGYWITFCFQTTITFGLATLHFILAGANMNKCIVKKIIIKKKKEGHMFFFL